MSCDCLQEAAEVRVPNSPLFLCFQYCQRSPIGFKNRFTCQALLQTLDQCFKKSEIYRSDRYEEIHQLVTNTEKRTVVDLFNRATVTAGLIHLIENYTPFLQENAKPIFSDVLMQHLQTGVNFHEIVDYVGSANKSYQIETVGCAAFSFLSLFNDSCSLNVVRHCHGSTIVLRALRPINKGERL